jgi:hypothetical protein
LGWDHGGGGGRGRFGGWGGGGSETLAMRRILRRDNALTPLSGSNLLLNFVSVACVTTDRACNGVRRSRLT